MTGALGRPLSIGATESGTTVTITTSIPLPASFSTGQQVKVSGVGVAGYNGVFSITATTPNTFQYTDGAAGLHRDEHRARIWAVVRARGADDA